MVELEQGAILALTNISIWLIATPRLERWGYAIGILSQPFWISAALRADQWGIFLNSCIYTAALVYGLWTRSRAR